MIPQDKDAAIQVSITSDRRIQQLNQKFRGKDEVTDVLSFKMDQDLPDGRYYLGDVVVGRERAGKQAREAGHSLEEEVAKLVEHGVLHLLGKHHEEDRSER